MHKEPVTMPNPSFRFCLRNALLCALVPLVAGAASGFGSYATSGGIASAGASTILPVIKRAPPIGGNAPVSDAEARQFADRLLAAARSNDAATLNNLFDIDAIAAASVAGLDVSEADKRGYMKGFRESQKDSQGILSKMFSLTANGGSVNLLRVVDVEGRKRARFRLIASGGDNIGYVDLVLGRSAAGQTLAQDTYIFSVGELTSRLLRRVAVQGFAMQDRGLLTRLRGADSDFAKYANSIGAISQNMAAGRASLALQAYNGLPDTIKADKTMKLMHIQIAQKLNDAEYQRAFNDFRGAFPNDPAIDLLSINYYLNNKQYPKALASIDRVDKSVGGDPYLDVQRAEMYIFMRDFNKARPALARGLKAVPNDKAALTLDKALNH